MEKAKVYFCKEITPDNVIKLYKALGKELPGKVAVKVHSGEEGNQNYLRPEFMKPMVEYINGTIVECNTAYAGERNTSEKHLKTLKKHGWNELFNVDLMDEEGPDIVVPVENGKHLKENFLGKNIQNYDSMLVISHFKGHPMGGYGGALKQLSIGCASSVKYFNGNMAFINVMCNMSVDCDCCAVAEDPCMKDIGILASLDPIAIDQACIDLVNNSDDPGKEHFLERVNSRNGVHTIERAAELGFGSREYELITLM